MKKINYYSAIILFATFVIVICFCIVYNAEWILGDDRQCMMFSGSGIWKPMISSVGGGIAAGRFGPLGHFEYNLLTLIPYGYTPLAHYIFNSCLFIVLSFLSVYLCLTIIYDNFSKQDVLYGVLLYIFLFIGSQHILSYIEVQYSHRVMSIALICYMLMLYNYLKTKQVRFLYLSFIFVIWNTYNYEVMFCVFATIAITYLLFNNNSKVFTWYLYFLVLNAIVYLGIYGLFVYPNIKDSYLGVTSGWTFLFNVFIWAPQTLVSIVLSLFRFWFIIYKKDQMHLFYDSTLFSSAILTLSYFVLKQAPKHNYQCVGILLLPSLCFWGYKFYTEKKQLFVCCVFFFFLLFIRPIHVFPYTIKNIHYHRKEDMKSVEKAVKRIVDNKASFVYRPSINHQEHKIDRSQAQFITWYLEYVSKNKIMIDSVKVLDKDKYPTIFLTKYAKNKLTEIEIKYIQLNYDSITVMGDFECVVYEVK